MARPSTKLALLLLQQYCGTLVEQTAACLLQHGPSPLRFIVFKTKQPVSQTRTALCLLMQHRFCESFTDSRGVSQYQISLEKILDILNYCKYPQIIGVDSHADDSPVHFILTTLFQEGQITIKNLATQYREKYPDQPLKPLEDAFCQMFKDQYIACSFNATVQPDGINVDANSLAGVGTAIKCFEKVSDLLNEVKKESGGEPAAKRVKEDTEDAYFWCLNHIHFKVKMQYQLVLSGLKSYYVDENLVSVASAIVQLATTSAQLNDECIGALTIQDINRHCKLPREQLTDCLKLFQEEVEPLISLDLEKGLGSYKLATKKVLKKMLGDTFAIIVGQKLSTFHARIFRMIRDKGSLPQKLIEEIAMVTPKECKEYVFDLVKGGYLKTRYYSKAQDYVPAKTHFVFTIDLYHLVRKTMQECCHAIYNAMKRRIYEEELHKQLIDRKKYIDDQIEILSQQQDSQQQIEDLKSSFTSHDLEVIEKAQNSIKKLEVAELQVTQTLTLIMSWLAFNRSLSD